MRSKSLGYVIVRAYCPANGTQAIQTPGLGFEVIDVGGAPGHAWILPSISENPPPGEERFGSFAVRVFPGYRHRGRFDRIWLSTDTADPATVVLRIITDPHGLLGEGPSVAGKTTLIYSTGDVTILAAQAAYNLVGGADLVNLVRPGIGALGLGDRNSPNALASDVMCYWDGWISADQIFSLVVACRELQDDDNTGWRTVQRFDSSSHPVFTWNTPSGVTAEEVVDLSNGTGFYPFDTGTFQRNYLASRVAIPPGRLRLYIDWNDGGTVDLVMRCNIGARAA